MMIITIQKYVIYDVITYFTFKSIDNFKDKCTMDALSSLGKYMIQCSTSNILLDHVLSLLDDKFDKDYIKDERHKIPTNTHGYQSLLVDDV